MNYFTKLEERIKKAGSLVCIGLDVDLEKIPKHILSKNDPVFEFNKAIIDYTKELVCAYKPNMAFYEALGIKGLKSLKKTIRYIPSDILVIGDGKKGDIGNTASAYAKGMFDFFGFDAVTVNPYMGQDSIEPFTAFKDKGIFILTRTSNPGGADFQNLHCNGKPLYQKVVEKSLEWNTNNNIGLVVGATVSQELNWIRKLAPKMTFLIPGIGAQSGDLEKTLKNGLRSDGMGAIIVSARGIIYASKEKDFAEKARKETKKLKNAINKYR